MGNASYSTSNAFDTRASLDTYSKSLGENFKQREVHKQMRSIDAQIRECRDSDEHPNALAIILGLDVTGSMGGVPQMLVRDGLPDIMGRIIQGGFPDPAVLFLGIGDHEFDTAPLQVGQFESGDEELDHWLMNTYLEGGGGGNTGESYLLAWYFAANHTSIDCWEKRGKKGLIITIGDEPPLENVPASALKKIMDRGQFSDCTAEQLLSAARERYIVHHIHLNHHGSLHGVRHGIDRWVQLLGDDLHVSQSVEGVANLIVDIVLAHADKDMTQVAHDLMEKNAAAAEEPAL